mmetsp:Transcript_67056/g.196114  ORF Transcript_67056/g.196114 Transcript_67056/m.196114 type:complete len:631 (-) Transcript_67056:136-2028(-)
MALRDGLGIFRRHASMLGKSAQTHVVLGNCRHLSGAKAGSVISRVWDGTSPQLLSKDAVTLPSKVADSYGRWRMFPRAFLVQVPCGAINAWSMWQAPLSTNLGVLAPSAADWSLGAVAATFPWLGVGWGFSMAFLGPWIDRAGPRYATMAGGILIGGGHLLSALGCYTQCVPLVWLGWGFLGGIGMGLSYTAPIGALLRWYPDRKGLATGLAVGPYALGGLFAAPLIETLRGHFFKAPTYAGAASDVEMKFEAGKQLVKFKGEWCEAVFASAADIAKAPADAAAQLAEGLYLVGTGDSGCLLTLATLGSTWMTMMILGGWFMYIPPASWAPVGWTPPVTATSGMVASGSVTASAALRTPQFWLMWLTLAGNASAGVLVIPAAKVMMVDIFSSLYPSVVTVGFSTAFVSAIALGNCGGRIGWAGLSDYIGCKNAMFVCSLSLPACMLAPHLVHLAVDGSWGTVPLYLFYGTTLLLVSWYGGSLALVPAYATHVFGPKEFASIYGRLMTGWSAMAIVSPTMLNALREHSTRQGVDSLVAVAPPEAFERAFQAPVSELSNLVDAKVVTLARLMEIVPPGTLDPAPFIYDSTFYTISGALAMAVVTNSLITKVNPRHFIVEAEEKPTEGNSDSK